MKKILFLILLIICISLSYIGFVISNHKKMIIFSDDIKSDYYGSSRSISINDKNIQYYDMIYLRNDGSFYLTINNYDNDNKFVGDYQIKDDIILLSIKTAYLKNDCFTLHNEIINGIIDENSIILNYNNEKLEYKKNVGISETINNRNYYIINPIDGEKPIMINNTWNSCNKK